MARVKNRTLEATQSQVPVTARQPGSRSLDTWTDGQLAKSDAETEANYRLQSGWMVAAKGYQERLGRSIVGPKKDGLSAAERFFCAAFSLLVSGRERADLDREIDGTMDAETSEGTFHRRPRTCGRGSSVRTSKYAAGYSEAREKRYKEKRFHDAVLRLFDEGFTREQLHRLAAQAVEI
jgi:hypothetical protein